VWTGLNKVQAEVNDNILYLRAELLPSRNVKRFTPYVKHLAINFIAKYVKAISIESKS